MRYQERASVLVDMPENAKGRLIMVWTKLLRVAINHSPSKNLVFPRYSYEVRMSSYFTHLARYSGRPCYLTNRSLS